MGALLRMTNLSKQRNMFLPWILFILMFAGWNFLEPHKWESNSSFVPDYDRCKCLEFCLDWVIAVEILEHCTIQLHFVTSTPSTHPIPRSPFTSSRSLIHLISKSQYYYYYYNAYNVTQKNTHSTNSLHLFQISESTNWNIHFKIMWLMCILQTSTSMMAHCHILVSARFIDASMYCDTFHAIRIAIQFARIAISEILRHSCVFYLNVAQKWNIRRPIFHCSMLDI